MSLETDITEVKKGLFKPATLQQWRERPQQALMMGDRVTDGQGRAGRVTKVLIDDPDDRDRDIITVSVDDDWGPCDLYTVEDIAKDWKKIR
jgi:hypothetical protein